ncbi:cupin domain-containing protein [Marinimicrobium agarilyticum]|uniref:cupin domain-containing protein n=1 Tax=Marinimicrobium TaxID=359337 RepID=UPI00146A28B3|nr:cupin domain-containing protein [Marinimicrobium agarilyticum]
MRSHISMLARNGAGVLVRANTEKAQPLEHKGWKLLTTSDAGLGLVFLEAEPGADEFPIHSSEDAWVGMVVRGTGTLFAGDRNEVIVDGMDYREGDFITFEPNTPHAWRNNGSDVCQILLARRDA